MRSSRRVGLAGVLIAAGSLMFSGTALAAGTTIFNDIPSPTPDNVPSVGYEATSTSEFGGLVEFAPGASHLQTVTVLMSSWACESGHWSNATCVTTPGTGFNHPITVNVYEVGAGNSVGSLLATATETFFIPYRPSDDASCGDGWGPDCVHGIAFPITFDLSSLAVTLPSEAIITVAYNTSHYGSSPLGTGTACYGTTAGCGYDSLNVGTADPGTDLSVGSVPAPDDAYLDSSWGGAYCDAGVGGTGSLRLDAAQGGCSWTGYQLAAEVTATYPEATSANDCKKGGWQTLARADGSTFKNQGDCIQYVNTGK